MFKRIFDGIEFLFEPSDDEMEWTISTNIQDIHYSCKTDFKPLKSCSPKQIKALLDQCDVEAKKIEDHIMLSIECEILNHQYIFCLKYDETDLKATIQILSEKNKQLEGEYKELEKRYKDLKISYQITTMPKIDANTNIRRIMDNLEKISFIKHLHCTRYIEIGLIHHDNRNMMNQQMAQSLYRGNRGTTYVKLFNMSGECIEELDKDIFNIDVNETFNKIHKKYKIHIHKIVCSFNKHTLYFIPYYLGKIEFIGQIVSGWVSDPQKNLHIINIINDWTCVSKEGNCLQYKFC